MKTAFVRFYEELNYFLPKEKKKVRFEHNFKGSPSVKDMIESLGVPHCEVDLILVNGTSVDFKYLVKDKDNISVYPVFESLDIKKVQHLRAEPLRLPKFILDVHLGALAKYLRMFGIDSLYRNNFSDKELIKISLEERRTILTRDISLLKNGNVMRGYFVRNIIPEEQAKEIIIRFDLRRKIKKFSRCLECNSNLIEIEKEKIINQLPPKVRAVQNKFYICEKCNKLFWQGSHFNNMNVMADKILSGLKIICS